LLFENLNPAVAPFYQNVEIPTKLMDWPKVPKGQPRRASVNSFGFGGTNSHAIIESYDSNVSTPDTGPQIHSLSPILLSANSKSSLKRYAKAMEEYIARNPDLSLSDLTYTLSERRSVLPFRTAFAADSQAELQEHLARFTQVQDTELPVIRTTEKRNIIGIFTGQGAQWAGMGRELIEEIPWVSGGLDRLEACLAELPPPDRPSWSLREQILADEMNSRLANAAVSQPLCTAVQIVLVDLLHIAGIRFSAVVGHSSGNHILFPSAPSTANPT
jgi:hybrid polyketide synthase / nonribosomal peptide synthetase ACE1